MMVSIKDSIAIGLISVDGMAKYLQQLPLAVCHHHRLNTHLLEPLAIHHMLRLAVYPPLFSEKRKMSVFAMFNAEQR
jgi:hypothetical protein